MKARATRKRWLTRKWFDTLPQAPTRPRRMLGRVRLPLGLLSLVALFTYGCQDSPTDPELPPVGPAAETAPVTTQSQETETKNILLFGTLVSMQDGQLVIELPEPKPESEDVEVVWWEVVPGLDMNHRTATVFIEDHTTIQVQGDDPNSPAPNSLLMVAGEWLGDGISADLIVDYDVLKNAIAESQPASEVAQPAWREIASEERSAWLDAMPPEGLLGVPRGESLALLASSGTTALESFTGSFGGPAEGWDSGDLDVVIPGIPALGWTEINGVAFILGLGGGDYNFPFSFEANAPITLVVDSSRTVDITVQPKPATNDAFSFYYALGATLHLEWEQCWLFGAYCDNYDQDLDIFSIVNTSRDAAPMPGETLNLKEWACPGFDIKIFFVEVCQSMRFLGDAFYSDVATHDFLYMPLQPGWRYWNKWWPAEAFDGTTGHALSVRPATNPLNVDMDDFSYAPTFEWGYKGQVGLVGFTIAETPVLWIQDGPLHLIPTDSEECGVFNLWGTCGHQPQALTMTLPVVPVLTSLTSRDTIARYGDAVRQEALVRGANGPGSSPKQVSFYDGDRFLATEPIGASDVAVYQTSALDPCKHVIRAEYVGRDEQNVEYRTDKSLVTIVTGEAEWNRREGYWLHQYRGVGEVDFDEDRLQCYLDIVSHVSKVFGESRDASTIEAAHDVLFLGENPGSTTARFDRDLLVVWLNFANGGLSHTQLVDTNGDGAGDVPMIDVVTAAEQVRLKSNASEEEIHEQTNILHHVVTTRR